MKTGIICLLTTIALLLTLSSSGVFADDDKSVEVAKKVKFYIAKEHKKRGTNPKLDFEKIHKICGKNWAKRCRFWETRGKDKFSFRKRPKGKIYSIPGYLLK